MEKTVFLVLFLVAVAVAVWEWRKATWLARQGKIARAKNQEIEKPSVPMLASGGWRQRVVELSAKQAPSNGVGLSLASRPRRYLFNIELPPDSFDEAQRIGYDWNSNRAMLQKVAYGMVREDVSQEDKRNFSDLMARFARIDPLYCNLIVIIQHKVGLSPGILQSELTSQLPEHQKEIARYVLYFAHELGDIHRVKKGRSYQLFLP